MSQTVVFPDAVPPETPESPENTNQIESKQKMKNEGKN